MAKKIFKNVLDKIKPANIWCFIYLSMAIVLTFIPLFNDWGYEFSLVMTLLTALTTPFIVPKSSLNELLITPRKYKGKLAANTCETFIGNAIIIIIKRVRAILLKGGFLLLCSQVVIILYGLVKGTCSYVDGLLFFILMPVLTLVYSASLVEMLNQFIRKRKLAIILYFGVFIISLGWELERLYSQPIINIYNHFIGYFPGSLYDEMITVGWPFLFFRINTILFSVIMIVLAAWKLSESRRRGGKNFDWSWKLKTLVGIIIVAIFCYNYFGDHLGFAHTRQFIQRSLGARIDTEHFIIYYQKNTLNIQQKKQLEIDHELNWRFLAKYFQEKPLGKINSYIFPSDREKKRLMGAGNTMVAKPWLKEIYLSYGEFPHPLLMHEMAHIFAGNFGAGLLKLSGRAISLNMGLVEGAAVSADWDSGELTPHQWSAAMKRMDIMPDMSQALKPFRFWTLSASRVYTVSGSFVRFLIDKYGIERFKQTYLQGSLEKIYPVTETELIKQWSDFLSTISLSERDISLAKYKFRRKAIFKRRCPHQVAEIIDKINRSNCRTHYTVCARLYAACQDYQPDNPAFFYHVAHLKLSNNKLEGLIPSIEEYTANNNPQGRLAELLQELVADILLISGELKQAEKKYLSLVDKVNSKDDMIRILIKIDGLRRGGGYLSVIKEYFYPYFRPNNKVLLSRLKQFALTNPIAGYMLSTMYNNVQKQADKLYYLMQSVNTVWSSKTQFYDGTKVQEQNDLIREVVIFKAIRAAFILENYSQVEQLANMLLKKGDLTKGMENRLNRWIWRARMCVSDVGR